MTEPLAGLTPQAAVRRVRTRLEQAGVPDADYDARELYRLAGGATPGWTGPAAPRTPPGGWRS
ncbi:MAG: hypothetical protein ACLUUL_09690 [Gemmiger sp.]